MYKLYSIPGTCATGIHVLLNALKQEVEVINILEIDNFKEISPTGQVPLLVDGDFTISEGGAIALYLLEKHNNRMLPTGHKEKGVFLQNLFFSISTMHPAYGRMFIAMKTMSGEAQQSVYETGAKRASELWKIVDEKLAKSRFIDGETPSISDYLLCIYANWGVFFNVKIELGENVTRMIREVSQLPEFKKAFEIEGAEFKILS